MGGPPVSEPGRMETERLILRAYTDDDAGSVLDIHSRMDVVRWLSNPPFVLMKTLDEARSRIVEWRERDATNEHVVHYAIEVKDTGAMVGAVAISQLPNDTEGGHEVGWHLHPDAAGHGYATEAATALLDAWFPTGLDEIWCTMYPDNEPSARVAQRIGLVDLGIAPDPWYGDDSHLFRTTRELWAGRILTERLILRPFAAEDADFLFDMFRRPEVARWSSGGTPMTHRDEAVARIGRHPARIGDRPEAGIFLATSRESGARLGMAMLVPIPASAGTGRDDMEIGWHFHPDAWGHGFATEAAEALVDRAFTADIPELYAVTDPLNAPSQAVCLRLGMTDLGLRTDWYDKELRAFRLDRP